MLSKFGLKLVCLALLCACRNGVRDENQAAQTQRLEVASLRLTDWQNIVTQSSIPQSAIERKYYVVEACLVESALGEKMAGHPARLEGGGLKSGLTDGNGCLYWEHEIAYDYSAESSCQIFHKNISLADGQYWLELGYTIDTHTDKISDLSKSQGCLVQQFFDDALAQENGPVGLTANGAPTPAPELEIDEIEFAYLRGNGLQPSHAKELSFRTELSTCLRYPSANSPAAYTALEISIKDKERENADQNIDIITTNYQGCFTKYFDSSYEQYAHSHWEEKSLEITLLEGPLRGRKVSQTFYMNPWESKHPDIFSIDSRYGEPSPHPHANPKYNQLHLDRVSYVRVGNNIEEFKVNNYLGLTTARTYHVTLSPAIDRGHLFGAESERYVPVNNGTFRLKFMLLAPQGPDVMIDEDNYANFDYIAGTEKVVQVRGGSINVPVDLAIRFADLPRVATRVICAIKLEPIDDIGLRPAIGIGFFMAKRPWIRTNVFFSDPLQMGESEYFAGYEGQNLPEIEERLAAINVVATPSIEDAPQSLPDITVDPNTPLNGQLVTLDDFRDLELSEAEQDNLKKHLYKQFIDQHFEHIAQITEDVIYGEPDYFYEDSPRDLFLRHLRHSLGDVTFQVAEAEEEDVQFKTRNQEIVELQREIEQLKSGQDGQDGDTISLSQKAIADLLLWGFDSTPESKQLIVQLCRALHGEGNLLSYLSFKPNQFRLCQIYPEKFFEMERYRHSVKIQEKHPPVFKRHRI